MTAHILCAQLAEALKGLGVVLFLFFFLMLGFLGTHILLIRRQNIFPQIFLLNMMVGLFHK